MPEQALRPAHERPGGRAGEPRVLRLARSGRVRACDHLRVDVRLAAVRLDPLLARRRADRQVRRERALGLAEHAPGEGDPRVRVAEDAGVLLVAGRVARDLAELRVVAAVRGLLEDDAVRRREPLVHAVERAAGATVVRAGTAEDAPGLALDEDLPLLARVRADRPALGVERAHVPLAVPRLAPRPSRASPRGRPRFVRRRRRVQGDGRARRARRPRRGRGPRSSPTPRPTPPRRRRSGTTRSALCRSS